MKQKALALIALMLLTWTATARIWGPLPVTPAESTFFEYLNGLAGIRFYDNLPVEPWIQCDDQVEKRTFFSASLLQFDSTTDLDQKIQTWFASFLDHSYWARVEVANCTYDINHFNDCNASGKFQVRFRTRRIIYFVEGESSETCSTY